ncbi:MAG: GNAT family N-acetyltransferase [Pseudobdellovibrionaceae bacterium]
MQRKFKDYQISDEKSLLQIDKVHCLLKDAYWCKGIPKKMVHAAIESSLCFGVYKGDDQVAYARVVTDTVTFAWLCDVVVDEKHRGHGISKELVTFIMLHPKLQGLRRICLATKDAHGLYERFGFKMTETPQNWMEIKNNNIYLK